MALQLRRFALAAALSLSGQALQGGDCNQNGIEDAIDLVAGTSGDCDLNGSPDECDTAPEIAFALSRSLLFDEPPTELEAADLDRDGDIDLAVSVGGGIAVFHGDGKGAFSPAGEVALGPAPSHIIASDLDGDGDLDLVVPSVLESLDRHGGLVTVIANDGPGKLRLAADLVVGHEPTGLAAADMDADGRTDLAVACRGGRGISLLLNRGGGAFEAEEWLEVGGDPVSVAAADLNQDGRLDLVVRHGVHAAITALIQRTGLDFARSDIEIPASSQDLVVLDVGRDGLPDLAVTQAAPLGVPGLLLLENTGDAIFDRRTHIPLAESPVVLIAADLNGDGSPDLATASRESLSVTTVPSGVDGRLSPGERYVSMGWVWDMAPADVDTDGDIDLLVLEPQAMRVSFLSNDGSGRFAAPWSFDPPGAEGAIAVAATLPDGSRSALDFDRDGRPDLAVTSAFSRGLTVIFGSGSGAPGEIRSFPADVLPSQLVAADLDGDGLTDVAAIGGTRFGITILVNAGDRSFSSGQGLAAGMGMSSLAAGDLDGDADIDLASTSAAVGSLLIWENDGSGAFPLRRATEAGRDASAVVAADLDGDGDLDLAAASRIDSRVSLIENRSGALEPAGWILVHRPGFLVPADLDGDGLVDLVSGGLDSVSHVLWNAGGLAFDDPVPLESRASFNSGDAVDIDGDGNLDLALVSPESATLSVLRNLGSRSFADPMDFPVPWADVVGGTDIDGDGAADLALGSLTRGLAVVRNLSKPPAVPDRNRNSIPDACEGILFVRGDADASARVDIADPLVILRHLFAGARPPACAASGDADADGSLSATDAVVLLSYLFRRGPEPTGPFPGCDVAPVSGFGGLRILMNEGNGAYPSGTALPFDGELFSIASGDMDGDGDADLAVSSFDGAMNTFLNDGKASFAFGTQTPSGGTFPVALLVAGDLDGDGSLDLVAAGQETVFLNDGAARFRAHYLKAELVWPLPAVFADIDGDRDLDVVTLDEHGVVLLLNHPVAPSDDCDGNGVPDECQTDCDCNGVADSCDLAAGRAGDCDADGVADACEPDCDSNGLPDDCDIDEGRSRDANANGFPDECELPLSDCDGNEIPDDADVAGGALDCNRNGVPDACDVAQAFHALGLQRIPSPGAWSGLASDIDGNGLLDLIVSGPSGTWELRGSPGGRLGRPRRIGATSRHLAAADLDGDGDMDLAVSAGMGRSCNPGDALPPLHLRILAQEARGVFRAAAVHSFARGITSIETGDLTGDGRADIALSTGDGVYILAALGGGSFGEPILVADEAAPLTAADLDADGDLDIAVGLMGTGAVLANQGNGVFVARGGFPSGFQSGRPAAADLDRDGDIDLVTHGGIVSLNDGRGAFAEGSTLEPGTDVVVGDATGDGLPDIFAVHSDGVSLHANAGAGTFPTSSAGHIDDQPHVDVIAGDFDRDGLADVATVSSLRGVTLLLNLGAPPSFGRGVHSDAVLEGLHQVGALDADGDGDQDIVAAVFGMLHVYTNTGGGRLDVPAATKLSAVAELLTVADLDADQRADVALGASWEPYVFIRWNEGDGTFRTESRVSVLGTVSAFATLDMDGDGDLDLAAASTESRAISVVENDGGRLFSQAVPILLRAPAKWIIGADMDGDGAPDLVTGHETGPTGRPFLTLLRNDGQGAFSGTFIIPLLHVPVGANAADLDSDGDSDLIIVIWPARVASLLNLGDGRLQERVLHDALISDVSLAIDDFDGDGDIDLVCAPKPHAGEGSYVEPMVILLNEGDGRFGPPHEAPAGTAPGAVVAADLDGDGLPDITTVSEGRLTTVFPRLAAPSGDGNRDGVPDECGAAPFRRGDADADGAVGLADPVAVLLHLFRGGAAPPCAKAADADDDGLLDLADPVHVLRFLFLGGPSPAFPAEACGLDPTLDPLPCEVHAPCG